MTAPGYLVVPKLWESGQVITIAFDHLPNPEDVIMILGSEHAETRLWVQLAMEYKNQGKLTAFVSLLEATNKQSNSSYEGGVEDLRQCQVMLAEYFYGMAQQETEESIKDQLFHKAQYLLTGVQHGMKRKNHSESVPGGSSSGEASWSLTHKRIRLPQ